MKNLIVGASIVGLLVGLFIAFVDKPRIIKEPVKRCRVNKVIVDRPYGGVTPDITYKLVTDEGYVVFSHNREFNVGDSIEVQVVRVSK